MIKKIRLIGCQSWKDTVVELRDGINVLVADNGVGKSVIFKMIRITACPKCFTREERINLIRNGYSWAAILFLFDDGYTGMTRVYPGKVEYVVQSPDGKVTSSLEFPDEYRERLGILGSDKFVASIIDSDQALLLVNSNLRDNDEFIRLLTVHEPLERLKGVVKERLDEFYRYSAGLDQKVDTLRTTLNNIQYQDIGNLKWMQERTEAAIEAMEFAISVTEVLDKFRFGKWDGTEFIKMAEFGLILEKIRDLACSIEKKEDRNYDSMLDMVSFAEKLKDMRGIPLVIGRKLDYDFLLGTVGLFRSLCIIGDDARAIASNLGSIRYTKERIALAEDKLKSSAKAVDCPIYGEVYYDGNVCVPYHQ